MRTITVEVTAEDIAQGAIRSCDACPVARAIRRVLGEAWYVAATWTSTGPDTHVNLPPHVCQWIADFDNLGRRPVRPITFTLEIP